MPTREIERGDWSGFFDSFSQQHEGWLTALEELGAEVGAQVEVRELPFRGITFDHKGEEGQGTVSIMLSEAESTEHVAHIISAPSGVQLEQTEDGADEALLIEAADGTKTLLRFRSVMLPEMVDGIVMG
jgi:hypothetical protein